jgi:hypothetical protein
VTLDYETLFETNDIAGMPLPCWRLAFGVQYSALFEVVFVASRGIMAQDKTTEKKFCCQTLIL